MRFKRFDAQVVADATYTIRRPGASAWLEGVLPVKLRTEIEYAQGVVSGPFLIVGESGEVEGEVLTLEEIEAAIREMEG